jgi:hypothetical protein
MTSRVAAGRSLAPSRTSDIHIYIYINILTYTHMCMYTHIYTAQCRHWASFPAALTSSSNHRTHHGVRGGAERESERGVCEREKEREPENERKRSSRARERERAIEREREREKE